MSIQVTRELAKHAVQLVLLFGALSTAGCGGGGPSSSPGTVANPLPPAPAPAAQPALNTAAPASVNAPTLATPQPANTQPVPIVVTFTLPHATPAPTSLVQSRMQRRLQYISTANTQMAITVTPIGASTSSYSNPSATCTTTSCSATFAATQGPSTITLALSDGTNVLSSYSGVIIVRPGLNTFHFSANPVVHSVNVSLANTTTRGGTVYDDVLTINAFDADGQQIIGNANYVDTSGNPVALTLGVTNAQAGGKGTVTIKGPARITSPQSAPIYAHYDGNWLDHATISAAATSSAITSSTSATLTTIPYATEYTTSGYVYGLARGPDGNLWFSETNSNAIGKITTSGIVTIYSCTPCSQPFYITTGPDGNLWLTENTGSYIDKFTPTGQVSRVLSLSGAVGTCIRTGPDGNLWYSSENGHYIGKLSPSGLKLATYGMGTAIRGIGFGPDQSLWYATEGTTIGHISLSGTSLGTATVDSLSNNSDGIVTGPDGNMSSRPRELHPQPLTERCVNLSIHTALIKQTNLLSHFPSAQTNSAVA